MLISVTMIDSGINYKDKNFIFTEGIDLYKPYTTYYEISKENFNNRVIRNLIIHSKVKGDIIFIKDTVTQLLGKEYKRKL